MGAACRRGLNSLFPPREKVISSPDKPGAPRLETWVLSFFSMILFERLAFSAWSRPRISPRGCRFGGGAGKQQRPASSLTAAPALVRQVPHCHYLTVIVDSSPSLAPHWLVTSLGLVLTRSFDEHCAGLWGFTRSCAHELVIQRGSRRREGHRVNKPHAMHLELRGMSRGATEAHRGCEAPCPPPRFAQCHRLSSV